MSKLLFKLSDLALGFLPLMVVGSISWCASWLLLPANIESEVFYLVVCLVAVHVIYKFICRKWSAKVFSHDEPMLRNKMRFGLHGTKQWQVGFVDISWADKDVAVCGHATPASILALGPLEKSTLPLCGATGLALAVVVWALNLLPQCADWIPAFRSAVRTSDFRRWQFMPVHTLKHDVFNVYRRVRRKIFQVRWPSHVNPLVV